MQKQKRARKASGGVAVVLLMALAVGVLVILATGLLLSVLIMKGVGVEIMKPGVSAAVFLAALSGGVFAATKMKRAPLLWGICVAMELCLICLLVGVLACGVTGLDAVLRSICAALAGGVVAGMLAALADR